MLPALTQFCCGCPVVTGVYIIQVGHLAACVLLVWSVFENLVLRAPTLLANWSYSAQLLMIVLYLAGIPIILSGLWGTYKRIEAPLRLYIYYYLLNFAIDVIALVSHVLMNASCTSSGSLLKVLGVSFGEAFLCGVLVIGSYLFVGSAIFVMAYCLWVVYSFAEDIHDGFRIPMLSTLVPFGDPVFGHKKARYVGHDGTIGPTIDARGRFHRDDRVQGVSAKRDGPVAGVVGFANSRIPGPYPAPEPVDSLGMPATPTLFGGTDHEMNYPPKAV